MKTTDLGLATGSGRASSSKDSVSPSAKGQSTPIEVLAVVEVVVMKVSPGISNSRGQAGLDKERWGRGDSQGNGHGCGQEAALGLSSLTFEVSPQLTLPVWSCVVCGPGTDKSARLSAVTATKASWLQEGGDRLGSGSR